MMKSLRAGFAETLYMGAVVKERQFHKLAGGPIAAMPKAPNNIA
jgi:hypothetical protein